MHTGPPGARSPLVNTGRSSGQRAGEGSGERRAELPHHTQLQAGSRRARGREGGSTSTWPAPLCPTHPVPSPPVPSPPAAGKAAAGARLAVARARREGRRTGCERGGRDSSGPLCWRWGRWRALSSEVSEAGTRTAVGQWEPGARTEKLRCGGRILPPVASRAHRWWRRPWPGPGSRAVQVRWLKDAAHLLGWVCALWVAPFS